MIHARVMTLNIWQEQGPWEQRTALIQRAIAALSPDVVALQEVRQVPGRVPNQAETLATGLGYHWTFEAVQDWGGGDEGLAILSRWPVQERVSGPLPTWPGRSRRRCLGAALASPAGPFWVFTTHLAYRLADGALRELQVLEAERLVAGTSAATPRVLCGDFNATPDSDEIRYLLGRSTLCGGRVYYQDAFAACNPGAPGHTWCAENPYTEPLAWLERDRRLDYIFVTSRTRAGVGAIRSCRIVCDEPDAAGLRCSDHYGLLAEICIGA